MAFNVAKIASARASLTISLTKSLRVAGPLEKDNSKNDPAYNKFECSQYRIDEEEEEGLTTSEGI